ESSFPEASLAGVSITEASLIPISKNSSPDYREFLLGFKPLEGTYSRENLSLVLLKRLKDYNITHRILAMTTDNASNNQTLIDSLNSEIKTLAEVTGALVGLLVYIKLELSNESIEREFKPRPAGGNKDILSTLNKNLIFLILRRAKRIRSAYNLFYTKNRYDYLLLDREEWR
ncbi:uncharacterized protein N7496_005713, partial [Penicillium cataractarum]